MSNTTWMSNQAIQDLTFGQLVLPGTHDTGSYSVQSGQLSEMDYGNIVLLWQLINGSAPANGTNPMANPLPAMPNLYNPINTDHSTSGFSGLNGIYTGPQMYDFIMQIAMNMSQSNDQDQQTQLTDGLRYFDWRLYWDTDLNGFYIQHGLRGAQLSDMLSEVVAFLNANSGASELIVIEVSHLNISSNSQQATDLVNAFKQTLPSGSIFAPPSNAGDPFLDLSSTKVSDITGGSNKVILLNTDSNIRYDDSVFINASGYAPAPNTIDGTNQVDTLKSAATTALNSLASGKLARLSWSLTCQAEDAVNDAVGILSQQPGFEPALKKIATEANMALPSFLDSLTAEQEAKINCITVDWHDQAPANESVVDLAIEICNHRTTT